MTGEGHWAYEIDGRGGAIRMDDANAPSLLALPYLGACRADDPRYLATRRWVLSPQNPWWFAGTKAEGVGSPHTGPRRVWPIALAKNRRRPRSTWHVCAGVMVPMASRSRGMRRSPSQSSSKMVALAMPPASHIACRP